MHNIKKAAITREGFEYQDCLGMEFLIDMYTDPSLYEWVQLDSENKEFQHVDDIVAKRKQDGKFVCRQVKFRVEPDREDLALSFEWLLNIDGGDRATSLIQKWAKRVLDMLKTNSVHDAKLLTNAIPDKELSDTMNETGYINFDKIPDVQQKIIIDQLGSEEDARNFFDFFQFEHSKPPKREELARLLRDKLIPSYTDEAGWRNLQQEVRNWAIYKNNPMPDGCIKIYHISGILNKERPRPIPQDFSIPTDYKPPDREFHRNMLKAIQGTGITVISGSPGRGKSTYISYLCKLLGKLKYPLIRHHYFLSLEDLTGDRYTYNTVSSSLHHQMTRLMPEVSSRFKESEENLKLFIEACAVESKDKQLIIVIDGLDHVWRENSDINQMRALFNRLLPLPPNVSLVVGTQAVPENQLPSKLLQYAPYESWNILPLMSLLSVKHWLTAQTNHNSIEIKMGFHEHASRDHCLNELSEAFYDMSAGHPLHLVYSFESLIAQTKVITIATIAALPKCPDGDIRKYYEGLWGGLSIVAKEFLYLFTASEFYWPENGLYECLGYDIPNIEAFNSIRHLLDRRKSGLVPFHGSIIVFIKSKSEYADAENRLLPKAIDWLEKKASPYMKWSWLGLTQVRVGELNSILNLPSREWAIEAFRKGYPISQMELILDESERVALHLKEYVRLQELRHLKIRILNGPQYQTHNFDIFQNCISFSTNDLNPIEWMADNLPLIDDESLVLVARRFKNDMPEIPQNCLDEMNRRAYINYEFKNDHFHQSQNDAIILSKVASYVEKINPVRLVSYTAEFSSNNFSAFHEYIASLFVQRKIERLLGLWVNGISSEMSIMLIQPIIRLACLEKLELDKRGSDNYLHCFAFSRCWLKVVRNISPNEWSTKSRAFSQEPHVSSNNIAPTMYEHFFLLLDIALNAVGDYCFIPIPSQTKGKDSWAPKASEALELAAKEFAQSIIEGQKDFQLKYLFQLMDDFTPPQENRGHEHEVICQSLRSALVEISIDLYFLFFAAYNTSRIEFLEIDNCKPYKWWNEYIWYDRCLDLEIPIMSDSAAKEFFEYKLNEFQKRRSEFIERTNEYIKLSKFALMHGLINELNISLNLVIDCMLGYGGHKDINIFGVIEAIKICQANTSKDVGSWLDKLKPVIMSITDITDGDETRHAHSEYNDLVAKQDVYKLIEVRSAYLSSEEWHYADQTLEAIIKFANLKNASIVTLIETCITETCINALRMRSETGDEDAKKLYLKQLTQIGKNHTAVDEDNDTLKATGHKKDKNDVALDASQFLPENIKDFIEHIRGREWSEREAVVEKWMDYWLDNNRGVAILSSINDAYQDPATNTYFFEDSFDAIYNISRSIEGKEAAYKWLVRAHIKRNGWDKYFAGSEEVINRLQIVAQEYPEKWQQYIDDTAESRYSNNQDKRKVIIGQAELVRFLFMVGQREIAEKMTDTLVNILLSEMADQPLKGISHA